MSDSDWYRRRAYPHFDPEIGFQRALSIVIDSEKVAARSFFPLIRRIKKTSRFKKAPKRRKISFASHIDAHIYAYYSRCIVGPQYENWLCDNGLSENIIAYRSLDGKCNIHFANDVFAEIRSRGQAGVVALDVSGFFDELDHRALKKQWIECLGVQTLPHDQYAIYKSLTKYAYVKEERLRKVSSLQGFYSKPRRETAYRAICEPSSFRTHVASGNLINSNESGIGVPQGTPISALLSNIYMMPFDQKVKEKVENLGGYYRRYSDDIMLILDPGDVDEVIKFVFDQSRSVQLRINEGKTERYLCNLDRPIGHRVTDYDTGESKPVQYLGLTFDGENVRIRPQSLTRYYRTMTRRIANDHYRVRVAEKGNSRRSLISRRKYYRKFSHLGKRNFISYAHRAAEITGEKAIARQVRNHAAKLDELLKYHSSK